MPIDVSDADRARRLYHPARVEPRDVAGAVPRADRAAVHPPRVWRADRGWIMAQMAGHDIHHLKQFEMGPMPELHPEPIAGAGNGRHCQRRAWPVPPVHHLGSAARCARRHLSGPLFQRRAEPLRPGARVPGHHLASRGNRSALIAERPIPRIIVVGIDHGEMRRGREDLPVADDRNPSRAVLRQALRRLRDAGGDAVRARESPGGRGPRDRHWRIVLGAVAALFTALRCRACWPAADGETVALRWPWYAAASAQRVDRGPASLSRRRHGRDAPRRLERRTVTNVGSLEPF